jgi:uncharacterized protein YqeY
LIVDDLRSKLIEFQKSKDNLRLGVLRYFLAQVKNKEIELRPQGVELKDKHVWKVLKKMMKQRKESIQMAEEAGRDDVVEKEQAELGVLKEFSEMFPEELRAEKSGKREGYKK